MGHRNAFVLLVMIFALCFGAIFMSDGSDSAASMQITADDIECDAGDSVTVVISAAGNPGFAAAEFGVSYDPGTLSFISAAVGESYSAQHLTFLPEPVPVISGDRATIRFCLVVDDPSDPLYAADATGDGALVRVSFRVGSIATPISTVFGLDADSGYFSRVDGDPVAVSASDSSISLKGYDISFVSDGVTVKSDRLCLNAPIESPASVPERDFADGKTYAFSHWEGYTEGMTVSGDRVFDAVFVLSSTDGGDADGQGSGGSSENGPPMKTIVTFATVALIVLILGLILWKRR